jgi:hypothetical protein
VIGMEHHNLVQRLLNNRVHLVLFRWNRKQHMQEIPGIREIVSRVDRRLLDGKLIAHRRKRRHFGKQAGGGQRTMLGVFDIQHIVIERGQCAHHGTHQRHRMGVATKSAAHFRHLLMHQGVAGNFSRKT